MDDPSYKAAMPGGGPAASGSNEDKGKAAATQTQFPSNYPGMPKQTGKK